MLYLSQEMCDEDFNVARLRETEKILIGKKSGG